MATKNEDEIELLAALANLRWSADGGTWSARVTPSQCRAVLRELDRLKERADHPLLPVAHPEPGATASVVKDDEGVEPIPTESLLFRER